jgi:hypothetical protein
MIKQVDIRAVEKDLIKTPKAVVIKFRSGSMISRSMVRKRFE